MSDPFANGMLRVGRPHAGAVHLIHPDPARRDKGPRPWCSPARLNMDKRAYEVPDESKIDCIRCRVLMEEHGDPR